MTNTKSKQLNSDTQSQINKQDAASIQSYNIIDTFNHRAVLKLIAIVVIVKLCNCYNTLLDKFFS